VSQTDINRIKEIIVKLVADKKEGHLLSSWSVVPIIYVLYKEIIKQAVKGKVNTLHDDALILSKGHGALGWYAVLNHAGIISDDEINGYLEKGSNLGGHPDARKFSTALASTGSLGHGFPISIGLQALRNGVNSGSRVFCIIGDGECMEGTLWESLLLAQLNDIHNMVLIVDYNHSHVMGPSVAQLEGTFEQFGWERWQVSASDTQGLSDCLIRLPKGKNSLVIVDSVRGEGVPQVEGKPEWHHKVPNALELQTILKELRA